MVKPETKMIAVAFLISKYYKQPCYKNIQIIIQIEKLHKNSFITFHF